MDLKKELNVREAYLVPGALMEAIFNPEKLANLIDKYPKDLSTEHFREFFMETQSDRKGDKQDYTPDSITEIVSKIIGSTDNLLDIAGGIGGLTVKMWNQNKNTQIVVEEISSASIPFLLFNLIVRNANAAVIYGNTLERVAKEVYLIKDGHISIAEHNQDVLDQFNLKEWVDEL